jgi:hypothetical protein
VKSKKSSDEERTRLLEAGWEATLRGGVLVWRRPGEWERWFWCSQEVAIGILEMMEEEKDGKDGSP